MASHLCHAHGCQKAVPPRMLMCRSHWASLPPEIQDAIWREYRPRQEVTKQVSSRYMAVQRLAVLHTAFKPNDEEAARVCAVLLGEAMIWQKQAIATGLGDPLVGLLPE